MKTLRTLIPTLLAALGLLHGAAAQELTVQPSSALSDEQVTITLSGLEPGNEVTLRARMTDGSGLLWESWASFEAAPDGSVDLTEQAPLAGSYEDVDPMGLFWSMQPEQEPEAGFFSRTSLEPLIVTITAEAEGVELAHAEAERLAVAPDVTRREVREEGLVGTLFTPPGDGPHPAVVVLGGSEGGLDESQAAALASHGFVTLALAYFGTEGLPEELVDIPLETFYRALDWLAEKDTVDEQRMAIMGTSKGAEAALLVASHRPELRAVVANVPSHVVWQGLGADLMAVAASSWSAGSEALPYVPYEFTQEMFMGMEPGAAMVLEPMYRHSLERYEGEEAFIPVEEIEGAILLISAGDDRLWPSALMADKAMARLEQAGAAPYVEHLTFEEAGHIILNPYLPSYGTEEVEGLAMGGTAEANAAAAAESWPRVLDFLERSLRE